MGRVGTGSTCVVPRLRYTIIVRIPTTDARRSVDSLDDVSHSKTLVALWLRSANNE